MQAVAVGIHGADGGKAIDPQLPHRLGNAELLEPVHPIDLGHAVGVELGRPADGVEIDRPVLLQPPQGFGPHPSLANDRPDSELPDDVGLVGFLAGRGGRSGGPALPTAIGVLGHHRSAVVEDRTGQVDR